MYEILKVLDKEDLTLSPEERAEKAREFARECQRFSSVEKARKMAADEKEQEILEERKRLNAEKEKLRRKEKESEEARAREASEAVNEAAASGE